MVSLRDRMAEKSDEEFEVYVNTTCSYLHVTVELMFPTTLRRKLLSSLMKRQAIQ